MKQSISFSAHLLSRYNVEATNYFFIPTCPFPTVYMTTRRTQKHKNSVPTHIPPLKLKIYFTNIYQVYPKKQRINRLNELITINFNFQPNCRKIATVCKEYSLNSFSQYRFTSLCSQDWSISSSSDLMNLSHTNYSDKH